MEGPFVVLKLAPSLSRAWESRNDVGSLVCSFDPLTGKSTPESFVDSTSGMCYDLKQQETVPMEIFIEDSNKDFKPFGPVRAKYNLQPSMNRCYRDNFRVRCEDANKKTKSLKHEPAISHTFNNFPVAKHPRHEQKYADKRVRGDRQDVENFLFGLFERKEAWSMEEIKSRCEEPEAYLKEILKELCDVVKDGKTHNYVMKEEYRARR